ncbi:MAG: hypothetical protein Q8N14_01785 [Candidatus Omnitrophota bacterium]|nr:hypothetical protein [Candidatus Omnitrophota bacterium]
MVDLTRKEEIGQGIPYGVKFARFVNLVTIVVFTSISIGIIVKNYVELTHDTSKVARSVDIMIAGAAAFIVFSIIPAILLIILNKKLSQLKPQARIWQIVVSCILFIFFPFPPVGVALYGPVIYFILFEKNTRKAFGLPPFGSKGAA